MKAKEAINQLNPQKWSETPPTERLALLEAVRENLMTYGDVLAASDTKMKNGLMGEELYTDPFSKIATVVPMANTVTTAIEVYEGLVHGEMPKPLSITDTPLVSGRNRYDSNSNDGILPGRDDGLVPVKTTKLKGMTDSP